ncbi:MAG: ion transporter [Leptospiraceae bacterium]|nr:ion transporter [Leptospiraceae bacterium]MCP5501407.1 ion transporter [Leptospiraceae bacterium]
MVLEPKPSMRGVIAFLDKINPVVVFVSIIGLILEFTSIKPYVVLFNSFIDVFFVIDFLVRLFSFPKKDYFFNGYGWVDLLAAIPGFTFLTEQVPGFFKIFKILRIGRFFKIIRILRFLRIFSFLKKMKSDSPYIQERIMKIGVVIVLVLVVSIGLIDFFVDHMFVKDKQTVVTKLKEEGKSTSEALKLVFNSELKAYSIGENYYNGKNDLIEKDAYESISHKDDNHIIKLSDSESCIVHSAVYLSHKNNIMLSIILALIVLISIVIFYIGSILAKDIKIVNLIVDSIDADDYMLLTTEGMNYQEEDGSYVVHEGEEEITSLFKMVNRLIIEKNIADGGMMMGGGGMDLGMSFKDVSSGQDFSPSFLDNPSSASGGNFGSEIDLDEIREIIREENQSLLKQVSGGKKQDDFGMMEMDNFGEDAELAGPDFNLSDIKDAIYRANEDLKEELLHELLQRLEEQQKDVALKSIKLASKGIVNYLNDNLKK